MRCEKHNVETYVRCGKCETPVCPKCSLMGPAGIRCLDCASIGKGPLYEIGARPLALGLLVGLLVGTGIGYFLAAASGFGFFLLWGSLLGGGAMGETILRLTSRKRGPKIEAAAGVCAGLGALAGLVVWRLVEGMELDFAALLRFFPERPFYAAAVGLYVFSAVSRVRFF